MKQSIVRNGDDVKKKVRFFARSKNDFRYPISGNQGWARKGTIAQSLGVFLTVGYEF
ncbi:MAG: hypothetical protein HOC23_20175 [Halieaceae bacterium]|jgi:hypothetical protein|nr:hypothetical protein [Halieaceae bacterium]